MGHLTSPLSGFVLLLVLPRLGAAAQNASHIDLTTRWVGFTSIALFVLAANAGGAFSPFGDITTLMVWQKGILEFGTFFLLFIPSVVNFPVMFAVLTMLPDMSQGQ